MSKVKIESLCLLQLKMSREKVFISFNFTSISQFLVTLSLSFFVIPNWGGMLAFHFWKGEDEMTVDCWSLTCSLTPVWQTTLESGQTYPELSNLSQQNHFPHSHGRALSERPVFPPYISNKVPIKNPNVKCCWPRQEVDHVFLRVNVVRLHDNCWVFSPVLEESGLGDESSISIIHP